LIDILAIQARRAALAAQLDQARAQYDALEATLKALDRQLCAMAGGLQELDALLALPRAEDAGGVNGADALPTESCSRSRPS
jgi:hypothetical protein